MLGWAERQSADIWIYDAGGDIFAAVDVLASSQIDRTRAKEYVKAIGTPKSFPALKYFLLVTTTTVWLWRFGASDSVRTLDGEPVEIHLPGFISEHMPSASLDDRSLGLLVFQWLIRLREFEAEHGDPSLADLAKSGFVQGLPRAKIELGEAA